MTSPGSTG